MFDSVTEPMVRSTGHYALPEDVAGPSKPLRYVVTSVQALGQPVQPRHQVMRLFSGRAMSLD